MWSVKLGQNKALETCYLFKNFLFYTSFSLLSCSRFFPEQESNEGNLQLWFEGSIVVQAYGDSVSGSEADAHF